MNQPPVPITDCNIELQPDPERVILRFFAPGLEDAGPGDSRAAQVIARIRALSDVDAADAMRSLEERFSGRHADLTETFDRHATLAGSRSATDPSQQRSRLLGATFTHEYAIEAAALCNPSIVAHPLQPGNGEVAFVLSTRGIGEGHRSSIGFRTGAVAADGRIRIDPPGPQPRTADAEPTTHHRGVLHRKLRALNDDHENAAFVLNPLPEHFSDDQLRQRLAALAADAATRRHTTTTIANLELLAQCSYRVEFPPSTDLSERVLWPQSPVETHGMEDARFVEITDGSAPRYCATYTAYDGSTTNQNLLTTEDFVSFEMSPMAGAAAHGKGLALFPRRVGGRFVAMSRADRETNSIAYSDDLRCWDSATTIQTPRRPWEALQLGNCGSPIETPAGWLVLTHGVGPMRTYSIAAILLDLHEPHRVLGSLEQPLLTPPADRPGGYVPNVVYTCGALAVGDLLMIPYGIGDRTIAVATLSLSALLDAMQPSPHTQT